MTVFSVSVKILLHFFLVTSASALRQKDKQFKADFFNQTGLSSGQNVDENRNSHKEIIVWNGCESFSVVTNFLLPTVDKPKICSTGFPEYLENVKPQKTKSPFLVKILKAGIDGVKSLLITVAAKHKQDDGKFKSKKMKKRNTFQSIYISARSLKGSPVGRFNIEDMGTKEQYEIGYCCGESRNIPNFYELNVAGGDWTTDVLWEPVEFSGFLIFNITVVQDRKVYWILPPRVTSI